MQTYSFSLLKAEEYLKHKSIIPHLRHDWWLQDTGYNPSVALYISKNGVFGRCDFVHTVKGIRPVVTFVNDNEQFKYGQKFVLGNYEWITLEAKDNFIKALCTEVVTTRPFNRSASTFKSSEINLWLENVCCGIIFAKSHR